MLRPGGGMYHDIKRRLPYYSSDITDALNYRTFAGTVRIYFVKYAALCASPEPQTPNKQDKQSDKSPTWIGLNGVMQMQFNTGKKPQYSPSPGFHS